MQVRVDRAARDRDAMDDPAERVRPDEDRVREAVKDEGVEVVEDGERTAPVEDLSDAAVAQAISLLSDKRNRVGIYAGLGCMDFSDALTAVAELLQAPVATSVSGKGAISDAHPLAVGWGYGPHASAKRRS